MPSETAPRDAEICHRYKTENISTARLAIDFGISEISVKKILQAAGVTLADRVPRPMEGDKTLSARHVKIGKYVVYHRAFSLGVDRAHMAREMGWSPQKLSSIEAGTFNLTIMDLDDLARIFKTTASHILEATEITPEMVKNQTDSH